MFLPFLVIKWLKNGPIWAWFELLNAFWGSLGAHIAPTCNLAPICHNAPKYFKMALRDPRGSGGLESPKEH